jgi:Pentapeptide repeats (8 copies)
MKVRLIKMIELRKRIVFGGEVIYKSEDATTLGECIREFLQVLPEDSRADLYGADLSCADLYGADLSCADLYGADLSCADLYGADLSRANLYGAKISWSSHRVISEILKNNSNEEIAKLEIAGLIMIQTSWCWREFCELDKSRELKDWAM